MPVAAAPAGVGVTVPVTLDSVGGVDPPPRGVEVPSVPSVGMGVGVLVGVVVGIAVGVAVGVPLGVGEVTVGGTGVAGGTGVVGRPVVPDSFVPVRVGVVVVVVAPVTGVVVGPSPLPVSWTPSTWLVALA